MRLTLPALVLLLGCATAPPGGRAAAAPGAPHPSAPLALPPVSWSAEEQAVHVLERLAYGPSPRDLREVQQMGTAAWIAWQLRPGDIDDAEVDRRLADFPSLRMSTRELLAEYPRAKKVAEAKGIDLAGKSPDELRAELSGVLNPFQLPRQVGAELVAARLIRATSSRRQLQETLVDFWFNHFNVSADKGAVRWLVSPYERDTLRPHLFGTFRDLLGAVAHDPAMLFYLDNWA